MLTRSKIAVMAAIAALSCVSPVHAAYNSRGAVELSDGTLVPQNPSLPKPHLHDAQREWIRQELLIKDTEVETESAKDFTPKIGAKLPKGVTPDGLPSDLTQQTPQLADYGYSKMKDQILLINDMTGEIVDIIPE